MAHSVLRASVTADSPTTEGGPATVLVDGSDTAITANGLQDYTPTPGDRLLVVQVGGVVEIVQFISRGTVPGTAVADGSITDAKIAFNGLNPAKGIADMRAGAFTCFIHDWRFQDSTLNTDRFGTSTSITLETIAEEVAHPYNGDSVMTMGNVGDAPPAEYAAGPAITFQNVVNDTNNFANQNVVPMKVTGTLNTGDRVVSVTLNAAAMSKVGMAAWSGIATTYLNLDPATQNAALVAANGVEGKTRIEWLHSDGTTVIYSADGTGDPTFDYYGHYDYAVMEANNFSTAAIGSLVPTYIRVSMIWEGPTLTADAAGTYSFILPGFSMWYIGGPSYQPGTPYVRMDHDLPVEEVMLLEGLPVTPGDTYAIGCRRNPWSESIPYTGTNTSPRGGGELIVRVHHSDGTTKDTGPGSGTGSFEAAGWQSQFAQITMSETATSIDVLFHQDPYDPGDPWSSFGSQINSVDHFILPRLSLSGWGNKFSTPGAGSLIDDSGIQFLDSDGDQAIVLDATNNSGGAALTGYVAIGPRNPGTESFVDRDSSINMWSGGNDIPPDGSTQPDRVGIALDPYYNTVKNFDAPFDLGTDLPGSSGARFQVSADRGTTGSYAPKGFVGITPGSHPQAGATAVETGFIFDSDTNTITPVGTMAAGGRIAGEVIMWPSPVLPSASWLVCNGQTTTNTAHPELFDALHIESLVNTSFAAGTTTFTASEGAAVTDLLEVGWQVTSVAIGGTNIATVTAVDTVNHTFTIDTATAFGGPASFWFFPFGVASESGGVWTFHVPDYRRRYPIGVGEDGNAFGVLGATELDSTGASAPGAAGDPTRLDHRHTHTVANHSHGGGTNGNVTDGAHQHNIAGQASDTPVSGGSASSNAAHDAAYVGHAHGGATNNGSNDGAHKHNITSDGPGATGSSGVAGSNIGYHAMQAIYFIIYAGA